MENLFIYMAKASGLLAVFFIAYYVFLRKETFFTSNRRFLLAGLVTSVLLPLAEYTKVIWVKPAPVMQPLQHQAETISAADVQQFILMQQMAQAQPEPFTINWWYVVAVVYLLGVSFFLVRLITDFFSIRKILKGNKIIKEGDYRLIDSKKVKSPFSFFNYIVYNSASLKEQELESILSHEKVHSRQKHSADMIISQLFCIAFWFNPFVWLYKKSISQNLEFIADAVAIKQLTDRQAYQRTLLKITLQPECIAITNHFYQSLIKKRIVMLNKRESRRRNSWKYGIILPALAAFIMLFQVKVVAQEKSPEVTSSTYEKTRVVIAIDKDATDKELESQAKVFKEEFDADVTFSNIKRNSKGEITGIKVVVKDAGQSKVHELTGNNPINEFTIELEKDNGSDGTSIAFGTMSAPRHMVPQVPAVPEVRFPGDSIIKRNSKVYTSTHVSGSHNDEGAMAYASGHNNQVINSGGSLVIINGVKQSKNDEKQLLLPKGHLVTSMNVLSAKEAKKKYGKEGKKGAIEIVTAKGTHAGTSGAYSYSSGEDDESFAIAVPPIPPMPPMDEIMVYAMAGADEGMKVVASIDWENMNIPGLGEAERAEIREEMKRARAEVKRAFEDAKFDFDKQAKEYQDAYRYMNDEQREKSMEKMQAKLEKMQSKLDEKQKELEKMQKELAKKKTNLNKKAK